MAVLHVGGDVATDVMVFSVFVESNYCARVALSYRVERTAVPRTTAARGMA